LDQTAPQARVCVNLACGPTYVDGWHNLDYNAVPGAVTRANLLGRLPFADGSAGVLYSSHFLEHVPTDRLPGLLAECHRILRPGGWLRLCLPDLAAHCRAYLEMRDGSNDRLAEFVILALIDQCVRLRRGGALGDFYRGLDNLPAGDRATIERYMGAQRPGVSGKRTARDKLRSLELRAERLYCRAVVALLPRAFRQQNVSFTSVGERHMWMYDHVTLGGKLADAGFTGITRHRHDSSDIADFPLKPLDVSEDGSPRKGELSMYLEARNATVER